MRDEKRSGARTHEAPVAFTAGETVTWDTKEVHEMPLQIVLVLHTGTVAQDFNGRGRDKVLVNEVQVRPLLSILTNETQTKVARVKVRAGKLKRGV